MSSSHPQNSNKRTTIPQSQSTVVPSVFQVKERIHNALSGSNVVFRGPLSWILTLQIFAISLIWWISTLPIRISMDIYDRHIRAIFPNLPSIRNLLLTIRTAMLSIFTSPQTQPGATISSSRSQGRQGNNAPEAPIRTLPVDLNTLLADGS